MAKTDSAPKVGLLREHSSSQGLKRVWEVLLGALGSNETQPCDLCGLCTVLYFYSDGFGELALRLTVQPVHCTDKRSILRECKLTRQAHLDVELALLQLGRQGVWWDVELHSMACSSECLGLVGNW